MKSRDVLACWVVIGALGIAIMSRVPAAWAAPPWLEAKARDMEEQLALALQGGESGAMAGVRVGYAQSMWNELRAYDPPLHTFGSPAAVEQGLALAWSRLA